MRRLLPILLALCVPMHEGSAELATPDGTWLVSQRVAFDIFPCKDALCGKVAWLRNPALRTPEMCGRTIIWGLTSNGPSQWGGGWFFDPENGSTYSVSAYVETPDQMIARIYRGFSLFGKTEVMTRISAHSLPGWCDTDLAR